MPDYFPSPNVSLETAATITPDTNKNMVHKEMNVLSAVGNVMVCNPTGAAIDFSAFWYDNVSSTEYTLISAKSIGAGTNEIMSLGSLPLRKDDELRVQGSATGLHVIFVMAETPGRVS